MTVDAHHHLWDPSSRSYPWMDESVAPIARPFVDADLRAALEGTDVTGTVVVQAAHDLDETRWLLDREPPVLGVVGWVDLRADDVADVLAGLREGGHRLPLVGVRHQAHDEADAGWLARPDVRRGVRAVAAAGLVVDLLVRQREADAALALVDDVPEGRFVLDHAGKPPLATGAAGLAGWAATLGRYASRPSVTCKLSGLFTEAGPGWRERPVQEAVGRIVDAFGPDRVAFGSDWPVSALRMPYGEVLERTRAMLDGLTSAERERVLGGTARDVYRL